MQDNNNGGQVQKHGKTEIPDLVENQGKRLDFAKSRKILCFSKIKEIPLRRSNTVTMVKGVITGDLVNSTNIAPERRQSVVDALNTCVSDFTPQTPIKIEMYRGDSFQVVIDKAELALSVAIAIRSKLRASTPDGNDVWDARVSVGIGGISFESDNIVTSDGEAFRLSGHAFDDIGKKRLNLSTPWTELNNAMELNTRFADELVSSWTARQARVAYHSILFLKTQKEMAEELDMTHQNFNYHWGASKAQLILDYIEYFKTQLSLWTHS